MITIDDKTYDVPVLSMNESCEFLDKFAERSINGKLHRELIGTYKNQQIKFGTPTNASQAQDYIDLWEKLCEPTPFHTVTVPDTDGVDFTFTAYFSNVKRSFVKWREDRAFWKEMTVNFIAQEPAARP